MENVSIQVLTFNGFPSFIVATEKNLFRLKNSSLRRENRCRAGRNRRNRKLDDGKFLGFTGSLDTAVFVLWENYVRREKYSLENGSLVIDFSLAVSFTDFSP